MKRFVAMTGLSGVGKTTFLATMRARIPFQHLQAGSLIKSARELKASQVVARDNLRELDLDENQTLLVDAFRRLCDKSSLVILDGHTVIERDDGFSLVPDDVFAALEIDAMLVLVEQPDIIVARRAADPTRKRPLLPAVEINRRQEVATDHARAIAAALNIPFQRVSSADADECQRMLSHQSLQ